MNGKAQAPGELLNDRANGGETAAASLAPSALTGSPAGIDPFLPRAEGAIKPEELAMLLKEGRVCTVDTREAPVFARAHLPGAVNMPAAEIETRLAELHMLPATPVVYCRSGDQTKDLAAKLAEQGIPVAFLEGGVLAWEAAGFRLERPD